MLERLGYRADVAANGLEALEALCRVPYAAVLMDVQMPEMDGYQTTAEIRKREQEDGSADRRTPIIAMTANAMQGDRENALSAGMDDYVSKPVKPEELEAALGRWVPSEEGSAETAADGDEINAANSEEAESTPLDEGVIENLLDLGGSEMLVELSEMYLEDARSGLAVLRKAAEEGDAPSVERAAHTLKGASGNMGALGMARTCAELEEAGGSGDLSRAPELLAQLDAEFGRVRQALPTGKT